MIKSTQKDEETGEEREVSKLGVYGAGGRPGGV